MSLIDEIPETVSVAIVAGFLARDFEFLPAQERALVRLASKARPVGNLTRTEVLIAICRRVRSQHARYGTDLDALGAVFDRFDENEALLARFFSSDPDLTIAELVLRARVPARVRRWADGRSPR